MWSQKGFKKLCIFKKRVPIIAFISMNFSTKKGYYHLTAMGQECVIPIAKYPEFIAEIKSGIENELP